MPGDSPTETVTVRPRAVPAAQAWEPGQVWVPDNAWPSQPEPSQPQPAQPEPSQPWPSPPEPAQPQPAQPDPAQPWQQPGYPAPDYPGPSYQQQGFAQQGYGQAGAYPAGPGPVLAGASAGGPAPSGGRQPRWPVVAGIVLAAALLGGGAGGYILVAHPFSHSPSTANNVADSSQLPTASRPSDQAPASTGPASPAATPAGPATPVATPASSKAAAEQQAASALSRLLTQSVSDRSAITQAYNDVSGCGPLLGQDQQTFEQAASSRQSLITQLSSLPGAQSLPAAMLSDLTGAWQASQQVDQDYAQWSNDEDTQGCASQDYTNPSYQAADSPNQQATSDKTAFVSLWNPIARKYGLPTYDQGEI
ncbi:MAG TPA: hypothetical protein VMG38_05230 [Trebonia sp.]|nr:hypothetical protein [Trebonia sp.]